MADDAAVEDGSRYPVCSIDVKGRPLLAGEETGRFLKPEAPRLTSAFLCYHRCESQPIVVMKAVIIRSMQDFEDDEDIPVISGRGEGIMEEAPATGSGAARRNEDIALDLMKFVAMTTGYGRTASGGVGFSGGGAAAKPEDYAEKLLELYGRCLGAVSGKK